MPGIRANRCDVAVDSTFINHSIVYLDRRYITMWFNVFIMQLSTERHVSTLQGYHQAYKIMVLVKVHAVILNAGSCGLQFNIHSPSKKCIHTLTKENSTLYNRLV